MELVLERLPVTIELCLVAMLIAIGLGGAMAFAGACWRGRFGEAALDGAAGFILAIPDFLWALLFILFVVVFALDGLPISGRIRPRDRPSRARPASGWSKAGFACAPPSSDRCCCTWPCRPAPWRCRWRRSFARVLKTSINEAMTRTTS